MILDFSHSTIFDLSITHHQTALQQTSSWMSANLLTLNSSIKTGFSVLVPKSNFLKQTTLHSIPLILHATLFLFLTNISP